MKTSLFGVAVAALLLSGCTSTPGQVGSENQPPASSESGNPPMSGKDCGGVTTEALEEIFGVELTGPKPESGPSDENGQRWTDSGCDWENDDADLELDLGIAVGSDFSDGTVGCFEPSGIGDITVVEGIGSRAWWKFSDINEAEGTLRVCTSDALIDFEIDAKTGSYTSDELRDLAREVVASVVGG